MPLVLRRLKVRIRTFLEGQRGGANFVALTSLYLLLRRRCLKVAGARRQLRVLHFCRVKVTVLAGRPYVDKAVRCLVLLRTVPFYNRFVAVRSANFPNVRFLTTVLADHSAVRREDAVNNLGRGISFLAFEAFLVSSNPVVGHVSFDVRDRLYRRRISCQLHSSSLVGSDVNTVLVQGMERHLLRLARSGTRRLTSFTLHARISINGQDRNGT